MKKLIINVDDVGLSTAINEAARQCYLAGVITGVSVMAGGKFFDEAVNMLKEAGKTEVGAHLTLTGITKPCLDKADIKLSGTSFPADYMEFMKLYASGKISFENVRLELVSQIDRIKNAGLEITHLDSHEHIHLFPRVLKIVIDLAVEYNIPYIRFPLESTAVYGKDFRIKDLLRHAGLRMFMPYAGKMFANKRAGHNDMFLGHFHSGRVNDGILSYMLENISDGLTELCVHPGVNSTRLLYDSPWHNNAPLELNALLSGKWKDKLKEKDIRLVSHKESL